MEKLKKHPLYIIGFLVVLGTLCAVLLALINMITAPRIKLNSLTELKMTLAENDIELSKIVTNVQKVSGVDEIYEGEYLGNTKCYVFKIIQQHQYLNNPFNVYVVLNAENGTIIDYFYLEAIASQSYNDQASNHDFGVIGSNKDNFENNFISIAGVSATANAVKEAFILAFSQYELM